MLFFLICQFCHIHVIKFKGTSLQKPVKIKNDSVSMFAKYPKKSFETPTLPTNPKKVNLSCNCRAKGASVWAKNGGGSFGAVFLGVIF